MCVILCVHQSDVHVCVGWTQGMCSPFPCSCPLNMSDVLARGITSGAEREAHSLSSPSPLYITFSDTKSDPFFQPRLHFRTFVFLSSAFNFFLLFSPKYLCTHLLCPLSMVQFYSFNCIQLSAHLIVIYQYWGHCSKSSRYGHLQITLSREVCLPINTHGLTCCLCQ